jgi:hypothetical protein
MKTKILGGLSAVLLIAGLCACSTTQQQKLASDVATYNNAVSATASDESKVETDANAIAVATTGTIPKSVSNDEQYAQSVISGAQAAGTLFADIDSLIKTASSAPSSADRARARQQLRLVAHRAHQSPYFAQLTPDLRREIARLDSGAAGS